METNGAFDWSWIIALLIIGGLFGGFGGFGYGNNARADISNEFLYNQMANDIRANGQAIATTDRDVLTTSCNTDKEILESRYTTQLGFQNQQAQMASCCCDIKSLIRDEVQGVKDLINGNTIQDLRDQLNTAVAASANAVQTQNILGSLGNYYPKVGVNPMYVYSSYPYGTYGSGTTIY